MDKYVMVIVSSVGNRCFYHALGDHTEFYDLDSLISVHPEFSNFVSERKHLLEMEFLRKKEQLNFVF